MKQFLYLSISDTNDTSVMSFWHVISRFLINQVQSRKIPCSVMPVDSLSVCLYGSVLTVSNGCHYSVCKGFLSFDEYFDLFAGHLNLKGALPRHVWGTLHTELLVKGLHVYV